MTTSLSRNISGYFLILIFCGYFGSTSFFPHSHIVNGVTIVHSHPFKSNPGDAPVSHNHSRNGFQLIQFISGFIAIASALYIVTAVLINVLTTLFPVKNELIRFNSNIISANRPRGPTLLLHN